ncbi:succinyl transferase OpgC [Rhizobium sp. CG5]|uniref:OpgC family protein n=1 Tax=Rhizobium sp. CG5 TaxID=2726076 RepID=UPI002034A323|nr:OpgC domain-containing protein [Rhizobium sp. CG5]MCM2477513.1 succinyl transferase OpgC [Rhizobium sp. CG5]
MKRLDVLDGMRGYFLVFMLLNHLIFAGGYWLVEINHRQLTFVEDAQGFVFMSGLLVGMVYARKMLKSGYEAGRDKIWARAIELYRYAMGIVLFVLAARLLLPGATAIWQDWLGVIALNDPWRLTSIATFFYQPTFMDILPQYIIYMIFAPALIWLCITGRWTWVAIGSLVIWMAGQLGLQRLITYPIDGMLGAPDQEGIRASFNLLGWQIVFFSGLVAGSLTAMKKIEWSRIFSPEKTLIPKVAAAILLFFLPLRIATAHDLMPGFILEKFGTMEIRADFGPVYLLNFAALAAGVAWLLIAGPRHHHPYVQKAASVLTGVFSLSFLQLLGRHSLHVYVWHVIIVFLVRYIDGISPDFSELTKTAIAISCVALLALPALYRERETFWPTGPAEPKKA